MNQLSVFVVGILALVAVNGQLGGDQPTGVATIDVLYLGNLRTRMHQVQGAVYVKDESTFIIDQFVYDGQGAGVYISVATKGNSEAEYAANRVPLAYPSNSALPIERAFAGERLVISLPATIKASDVKWISVWCEAFGVSFGDVVLPEFKGLI